MLSKLTLISMLTFSAVFVSTHAAPTSTVVKIAEPESLIVTEDQKKAFQLGLRLLVNHGYHKETLDKVALPSFNDYVQALDFGHIYFLQSDIDTFAERGAMLRNDVRRGDLSTAIEVFERYRQRATALYTWTLERLKKPFDLHSDHTVTIPDYRNRLTPRPWFTSEEEVYAYQEKRLIDQIIRLRLSGRSEQKAIEKLTARYRTAQSRLNQMTSDDVFDIYMNAIAGAFDPHSNYLSPKMTEDFDIGMSLSLEGIGATLSNEDDKIMINELVVGGPAYKSGKLHIKDRIIGVGQGKDGEIQDVIGMRLDKAVRLIRGKKGTYVRLLIEPANPNAPEREVLIQRDKISLEDQAAAGHIETVKEGNETKKIGVIRLPSFYMDFDAAQAGKKDYRSTSRDLERILKDMKKKAVEGIVLDLRGNGGGSLVEAIKTVGLFVGRGPVVQVDGTSGRVDIQRSDVSQAVWQGPLAVMINHSSASASEIFAGAIQDYHRGVIIGNNSFGKGTVQTVIPLNRFVPRTTPALGELKMTIAMFFRITGSSTQMKGVAPDIALPETSNIEEVGERSQPHALAWRKIAAADYTQSQDVNNAELKILRQKHQQRMEKIPELQRFAAYMQRLQEENSRTEWSLNYNTRRHQYEQWKAYQDNYDAAQARDIAPLKSDEKRKKDLENRNALAETEDDKENFVPDVGLFEALHILFDYIKLAPNYQKAA